MVIKVLDELKKQTLAETEENMIERTRGLKKLLSRLLGHGGESKFCKAYFDIAKAEIVEELKASGLPVDAQKIQKDMELLGIYTSNTVKKLNTTNPDCNSIWFKAFEDEWIRETVQELAPRGVVIHIADFDPHYHEWGLQLVHCTTVEKSVEVFNRFFEEMVLYKDDVEAFGNGTLDPSKANRVHHQLVNFAKAALEVSRRIETDENMPAINRFECSAEFAAACGGELPYKDRNIG